jgi:hypothetical protein
LLQRTVCTSRLLAAANSVHEQIASCSEQCARADCLLQRTVCTSRLLAAANSVQLLRISAGRVALSSQCGRATKLHWSTSQQERKLGSSTRSRPFARPTPNKHHQDLAAGRLYEGPGWRVYMGAGTGHWGPAMRSWRRCPAPLAPPLLLFAAAPPSLCCRPLQIPCSPDRDADRDASWDGSCVVGAALTGPKSDEGRWISRDRIRALLNPHPRLRRRRAEITLHILRTSSAAHPPQPAPSHAEDTATVAAAAGTLLALGLAWALN